MSEELKELLIKEIGLLRDIFSYSREVILHRNDFGKLLDDETFEAIKAWNTRAKPMKFVKKEKRK